MRISLLFHLPTPIACFFRTYLPDGFQTKIAYDESEWEDDRDDMDYRDPEYLALQDKPDDPPPPSHPNTFPDITDKIQDALDRFGSVIPKMNWSSPDDALWISPLKQLQCYAVAHVLLLLKGSYIPDFELYHRFENCNPPSSLKNTPQPTLSLIRGVEINDSREFRCFIINRTFVALSQRNCGNYFRGLATKENKARIKKTLVPFINSIILPSFPVNSFVVDVHLDRDLKQVTLIDLSVLTEQDTDILLFDWDEMAVLRDRTVQMQKDKSGAGRGGEGEEGKEGEEEEEDENVEEEADESDSETERPPKKPTLTSPSEQPPNNTHAQPPAEEKDTSLQSQLPPTAHQLMTKSLPIFRCVTKPETNMQPAFVHPGLLRTPDDAPEVITAAGKWSTYEKIIKQNKEYEERKAKREATVDLTGTPKKDEKNTSS